MHTKDRRPNNPLRAGVRAAVLPPNYKRSGQADEPTPVDKLSEVFGKVFLLQQAPTEFAQRRVLDLADAFPRDFELTPYFFERLFFLIFI